jgi:hypothetical protein
MFTRDVEGIGINMTEGKCSRGHSSYWPRYGGNGVLGTMFILFGFGVTKGEESGKRVNE